MPELPPAWDLLKAEVEGIESPFTCSVGDNRVSVSNRAIPAGAAPTLEPIVALLRSSVEIPTDVRSWLADMMTPNSGAACSISIKRSGRGRPQSGMLPHGDAVAFYEDYLDQHRGEHKRAEHETCRRFDISPSTLKSARAAWRRAREAHRAESE